MANHAADAVAIFGMGLGPGAAMSCYGSLMGWYERELGSKEVTVFMRFAVFLPFPLMLLLQSAVDRHFDAVYGSKAAYYSRLVVWQFVVIGVLYAWMRLPAVLVLGGEALPMIVALGVVLGSAVAPVLGAAVKMAAATDPGLIVFAQLGNTVGSSLAGITLQVTGFTPYESHARLCEVLYMPVPICAVSALCLALAFHGGHFDRTFAALDERRKLELVEADGAKEGLRQSDGAGTGSMSDDERLGNNMPRWIWVWLGLQGGGHMLDFVLLTSVSYFGNEYVTHELSITVNVAMAVGRLLALPWRSTAWFRREPLHAVVGGAVAVRAVLLLMLAAHLSGSIKMPLGLLLTMWVSFHLISNMHSSLSDMSTTYWVPEKHRETLAHRTLCWVYFSVILGMCGSLLLVSRGLLHPA